MTTAHRPTWKAAVGRAQEGGWGAGGSVSTLSSVRDVAAHTKLKLRAGPQAVDKRAALQESLRKLEEAEASRKRALAGGAVGGSGKLAGLLTMGREANPEEEEESRMKLLKATADVDDTGVRDKYDDADEEGAGSDDGGRGWSDLEDDDGGGGAAGGAGDAVEDESDLDASDSDDDSSDDSDDEDEEEALQAELAKIRAERDAVKAKEESEREEEERAKLEEAALTGNPLLSSSDGGGAASSGKMKRRWNDDVVFRNQARDEPDRAGKRRFINDTVRNDFHRRFLNKFVR
mmetsp:Transcript_2142/g.5680  ORF Transcript_2142/g.5680 Transcript_2142/m.5680 type:complete len:290 (-) Transcript_2142:49-918(-)